MKISEKANKCKLSPMRKFHPYAVEAQKRGVEIFHLNIGQPDIETPQVFLDTVRKFCDKTIAYAPSNGMPVAIKAVIDYHRTLGVDYEEKDVFITTGGSEALLMTMLAILDEGSEVIVPEPFYPNYATFIHSAGGVMRTIPTDISQGYRYAVKEKILPLINEKTRAILFSNPGNPTGAVLTPEELRLLCDLAKEHDLYIVSDEVYREFAYNGQPICCAGKMGDVSDRTVIIDSVSKKFSACGARIGMAITKNPDLQTQFAKFCQGRLSAATLDQIASAALFSVDHGYYEQACAEYKKRRDICYEKLVSIPGVVCAKPEGSFYLMASLPVDDAEDFQQWLLEEFSDGGQTVMFAPGNGFYDGEGKGKNEVRIAYVLNCQKLVRAMDLLKIGLEKYNGR